MELKKEQLKEAETHLNRFLPCSLPVYSSLMLNNSVLSDSLTAVVDKWPDFNVLICKPKCKEKGDLVKGILIYANDETALKETIRKNSALDWSRYFCLGFNHHFTEAVKAVASEKGVPYCQVALCNMMTLKDISDLPEINSSGIPLSSLNESHVSLVNQMWKFGKSENSLGMIRGMVTNFPSCCVLDAEGKPVSWVLMYETCAMGILYTLPEHRRKGYAKVLIYSMAKRLHTEGYPVYCSIEEDNMPSHGLFKSLGFTEEPSYKGMWFAFNEL
ncbi:glycine N-acyltransferase-like [Cheilinus undulatus]|uniref:glycine N-acyltransferase-like n=1 Tax=Cheilinus undulatus TaxID=241271 RepID=UPI001BD5A659|nr:glycine N-acyltransferase-like [Cheilinus undulatus]